MLVLFLLVFFTPASVRSEWLSNLEASNNPNEIQEKGVLFHERSKILLAEKFIKVEFLVPFPTYDFALKPDIVALMAKLASMWELPSIFCPLDFSSQFSTNSTPFNVTWMLKQIENEIATAELDVALLRNETAMFLSPPQQQQRTRHRRGSHAGLAALAAVGLFGGGLAVGSSDSCGLQGIFGSCQDDAKANAENIRKISDFQDVLTQYVTEFTTSTDKKFFMVENELAALHEIQKELVETQDKNWNIIQQQFDIFERNFHVLRDCNQLLFSNQQLNFNFDTLSSLLAMIHASVKSYRAALFAFRMNILNSIPVILRGHLPMSLVPTESLLVILRSVAMKQTTAEDRLSLAIPMSDLLSYFDSKLLADAITVNEGLLMTLNIPLASKQTVFTVYEAKLIPMPYPDDPQSALTWNIEAPYLALSEDHMESSVLSAEQFEHCLGSSGYRICSESVPTEMGHSSCLATLYSSTASEALAVCDTNIVQLPAIEQATNLGYGIWLIQSAHAVTLREVSSSSVQGSSFRGCRICLITLACGMQIMTDNIKIRSDLSSCAHIPPIKLQVSLPNPITSLIMEVPPLEELPFYTSKAEAGVKLLKEVKLQLAKGPKNREVKHMIDIARPYASEMKLLKPALTKEFNQYVPFRISFMLTLTVFIVSTALHLLFMYIYHRYNLASKLFPSLLDKNKKRVRAKPVMKLETTDSHAEDKFQKKFGTIYHLSRSKPKVSIMSTSMFEQATTQSKDCQSANNLHSSLIVPRSNSQVRPAQMVHDQSDIEAVHVDITA